ncbi:MAG: four helix bundle protein [Polyangiales bacterium]
MRRPPPLLHDAYDLTLALYRVVPTFPKAQRFVLGQRIERAALDVLYGIDDANDARVRAEALQRASVAIDRLRLLLRLATDLGFMPVSRHETFITRMEALGRQVGGWIKWAAQREGDA